MSSKLAVARAFPLDGDTAGTGGARPPCLSPWQKLPSPRGQPSPAEDAASGWRPLRELSPALWGQGAGTISSARESHEMPVPDFQAPAGLLGMYFLGGSLRSFLDPLGNSL